MEVSATDGIGATVISVTAAVPIAYDESSEVRRSKSGQAFFRDQGKSLLPFSRVQKIMKVDKVRYSHMMTVATRPIDHRVAPGIANCSKGGRVPHLNSYGGIYQAASRS